MAYILKIHHKKVRTDILIWTQNIDCYKNKKLDSFFDNILPNSNPAFFVKLNVAL